MLNTSCTLETNEVKIKKQTSKITDIYKTSGNWSTISSVGAGKTVSLTDLNNKIGKLKIKHEQSMIIKIILFIMIMATVILILVKNKNPTLEIVHPKITIGIN